MLRPVLKSLCLLLPLMCAMRLWQYYYVVRLQIFDLLMLGFILAYALHRVVVRRLPLPTPSWRQALAAKWIIVLVSLLTALQLDPGLGPLAAQQYARGMCTLVAWALGLTAIVLWLHQGRGPDYRALLRAYAGGAVLSSVYSFAEVGCASLGYDLGKAIFTTLSIFPPDFDLSQPFYYPWENFFRAVGFTGVNSQATYTASMIPLLIVACPFRRRWVNFLFAALCVTGTALTLSRNGFLTLCLAAVFYLALQPSLALRLLPKVLAGLVPVIFLFLIFRGPATQLLDTRLASSAQELAASRSDIVSVVWPFAAAHPWLGHGVNQFSVIIAHPTLIDVSSITAKYPTKDEDWVRASYANLHNNWLNWFFEGGSLLVLAYAAGYALLLRLCWRSCTRLGFVSTATLLSLLVSGMFNMTLDLFSTDLLFVLLPLCVTLESRSAAGPAAAPALLPCPC
ncbi:MAG: O-antigen ligase family protein [Opitutaceae bacterium]